MGLESSDAARGCADVLLSAPSPQLQIISEKLNHMQYSLLCPILAPQIIQSHLGQDDEENEEYVFLPQNEKSLLTQAQRSA
jgi:hypothetical protein